MQPVAGSKAPIALHDPPAVVAATGDDVDLLDAALPDVPRVELARPPVEGEPPRIAEAERVDLGPAAAGRERVVGRDRVRLTAVDIDAEDLAEQHLPVLRPVAGVTRRAAVAEADVEVAIRAEGEHAAVVVGERLGYGEEHPLGARQRHVRVRRDAELRDHGGPVRLPGVVDEEAAIGAELRVEGEAQEPALAAGQDAAAGDIQERALQQPSGNQIRMRPGCSRMNRRPLPSPACVTNSGASSPVLTTGTRRIDASASALEGAPATCPTSKAVVSATQSDGILMSQLSPDGPPSAAAAGTTPRKCFIFASLAHNRTGLMNYPGQTQTLDTHASHPGFHAPLGAPRHRTEAGITLLISRSYTRQSRRPIPSRGACRHIRGKFVTAGSARPNWTLPVRCVVSL